MASETKRLSLRTEVLFELALEGERAIVKWDFVAVANNAYVFIISSKDWPEVNSQCNIGFVLWHLNNLNLKFHCKCHLIY